MVLHLTPEMLEKAYDLINATAPFRGWRLPPGTDVVFRVGAFDTHLGDYQFVKGHHCIRLTVKGVAHVDTLLRVMAHEMIHLYQQVRGLHNQNQHNADFKRRAKAVCRIHGNFDPALFC